MTIPLAAEGSSGNPLGSLLFVAILGALFYLVAVRPNRRRMQALRQVQQTLEPGREVMTGAGMYGHVVEVDAADDTVTLEIAPGVAARFARAAVVRLVDEPSGAPVEPAGADG